MTLDRVKASINVLVKQCRAAGPEQASERQANLLELRGYIDTLMVAEAGSALFTDPVLLELDKARAAYVRARSIGVDGAKALRAAVRVDVEFEEGKEL
jgi:hypothetical protein